MQSFIRFEFKYGGSRIAMIRTTLPPDRSGSMRTKQ
jgi:hypothetical protein